jgi:3-oxoacyl-[acyl-carrier protein] reductase
MTHQKIALVTGVSRVNGIGRAICLELARRGVDIFFTYWRPYDREMPWGVADDEPAQIQQEIQALGVRCEKLELDLMAKDAPVLLIENVMKTLGNPSILVNNATYSTATSLESIGPEELDKHYFVNLRAVILLTAAFVKQFTGKHGRIINLSSGQSLSAMSGEIAYAVTKGAIETFTKTMQHELAFKKITINAVNPGLTDSGWLDDKQKELFLSRFPQGRLGLPEDAARLIGFLASEEAEWITGQVIHSEGAFMRE